MSPSTSSPAWHPTAAAFFTLVTIALFVATQAAISLGTQASIDTWSYLLGPTNGGRVSLPAITVPIGAVALLLGALHSRFRNRTGSILWLALATLGVALWQYVALWAQIRFIRVFVPIFARDASLVGALVLVGYFLHALLHRRPASISQKPPAGAGGGGG